MGVLIADDHPLVREALARTMRAIEPDLDLLEAQDYAETEAQFAARPGLVLLDIGMPGMDGLAGVARLCRAHPSTRIVVVSADTDPSTIRRVLALGVAGYLPKCERPPVLMQALKLVLAGGTFTPAQALADLGGDAPARHRGNISSDTGSTGAPLTARQTDVLRLLMQGRPNKLIARALGLTEGTVKIHIAAILRALRSRNRTEAVVAARRLGIEA